MQASVYPANASNIALDYLRPKNQTATPSYHPTRLLALPDHELLKATDAASSKIADRITPLQKAVLQNDHAFIIRELANPSSDPHQRSEQGFHLLHFAAQNGSPATLQIILKQLAVSVDLVDSYGQTPLHLAVAKGNIENTRLLLANGANPLCQKSDGANTIDIALKTNHLELATHLMTVPFKTDKSPFVGNALQHAVMKGDPDLVNRLLSQGARPYLGASGSLSPYEMAKRHPNPLMYQHFTSVVSEHFSQHDRTMAVMSHGYPVSRHFNQFYSTLETRLKKGANPNDLLSISINSEMDEITNLLISYGAIPTNMQLKQLTNMPKSMFAIWATGKWPPKKMTMFLKMATDRMCQALEFEPNTDDRAVGFVWGQRITPPIHLIHRLIKQNDLKTLAVVLADERFTGVGEDLTGHTPLDVAIMECNLDAVTLLLKNRSGHNMTQALAVLEMVKQRGVKNEKQQEALRMIEQRLLDTTTLVCSTKKSTDPHKKG